MLTKFDRGQMGPHYLDTSEIVGIESGDSGDWCTVLIRGGGEMTVPMRPQDVAALKGVEVGETVATLQVA